MGARGPRRTPTKIVEIRGRTTHRAKNRAEPMPETKGAKCPTELKGAARKFWKRNAPMLHKLGLLTLADLDSFHQLCEAWGRTVDAQREIRKSGTTISTEKGDLVSPHVKIEKTARADYLRLASHFGLTPSARTGLKAPMPEDEFAKDFG